MRQNGLKARPKRRGSHAAGLLRGTERVIRMLQFDLRGIEVPLQWVRQGSLPKMVRIEYEIVVDAQETDHGFDLLRGNLRQHGTTTPTPTPHPPTSALPSDGRRGSTPAICWPKRRRAGSPGRWPCWPDAPHNLTVVAGLLIAWGLLATARHRTVRSKGALSQKTANLMLFTLVGAASGKSRKLNGTNRLPSLIGGVTVSDGIARRDATRSRAADRAASPGFSRGSGQCPADRSWPLRRDPGFRRSAPLPITVCCR